MLTGSTRLKAGSATKAVLNAITTAAMVRLGKAYENLMVDLKPTSAKLVDRTHRIVAAATGRSNAEVLDLLERSNGEVKTAIVMGQLGVSADEARGRLAAARATCAPRSASGRGLGSVHHDVLEVAVALVVVEAVADDELVLDREADVVDVDAHQAARRLRAGAPRPSRSAARAPSGGSSGS